MHANEELTCPLTQDVVSAERAVCIQGSYMDVDCFLLFLEHERLDGKLVRHPCTRNPLTSADMKQVYEACMRLDSTRCQVMDRGLASSGEFIRYYLRDDPPQPTDTCFRCMCNPFVCVMRRMDVYMCVFWVGVLGVAVFTLVMTSGAAQ